MVELGPNVYVQNGTASDSTATRRITRTQAEPLSVLVFLDFATGATEALEILHHGNQITHGELRGDAFHFNRETGAVKMVNFGGGARAFENGLTSAGWSSLEREKGVEHKLQFIAPEQTGRLPAEPDTRTDIYSLGVLFYTMLTNETPFDGTTPLEIMQNVLSRRIPPVTSRRIDVPDALSAVIQRMTAKNIEERYKSTSGLKHDLIQIQKWLCEADEDNMKEFRPGAKDVSTVFRLPSRLIGRQQERQTIVDIIEAVSARQRQSPYLTKKLNSLSLGSTASSDFRPDIPMIDDMVSDSTSSRDSERNHSSVGPQTLTQLDANHHSQESVQRSEVSNTDENQQLSNESAPGMEGRSSHFSYEGTGSSIERSSMQLQSASDGPSLLMRNAQRIKRKGRCEVISISGIAGLGKSSLVQ
ncbi:hypothetical protein LTS18_003786, partial [Coniosporium uncinatum]